MAVGVVVVATILIPTGEVVEEVVVVEVVLEWIMRMEWCIRYLSRNVGSSLEKVSRRIAIIF